MYSTTLSQKTIVDAVIPGEGALRDTMLIAGGVALTAVCAQVTIPWQPVPFTLSTLSVMLCGLSLGVKRGVLSQLLYVLLGVAGVPVFAHGASGMQAVASMTGGYILAYAVVAAVLGWMAQNGWTRNVWKTAAAMAIGAAIVLSCGAAWLSAFIGWQAAVKGGVVPFVIPEILKAVVVIMALPTAWQLTKRTH